MFKEPNQITVVSDSNTYDIASRVEFARISNEIMDPIVSGFVEVIDAAIDKLEKEFDEL